MVKVAFVHPDLGIGGAERLVVDAALELSALGHEVSAGSPFDFLPKQKNSERPRQTTHSRKLCNSAHHRCRVSTLSHNMEPTDGCAKQVIMYTGYHDVKRCFEETLDEGEYYFRTGAFEPQELLAPTSVKAPSSLSLNKQKLSPQD